MRTRWAAGLASLAVVGGVALTTPAHGATFPEICGNDGTGYCMNAWGGGPQVAMYYGGVTNDAYATEDINPCNSTPANRVTPTCPFTVGSGMNSKLLNDTILRIRNQNDGLCVGTDGSGFGLEGACGDGNANGAANGVIMVKVLTGTGGWWLVDRYWSNHVGNVEYVTSPGAVGYLVEMDVGTRITEWNEDFQV